MGEPLYQYRPLQYSDSIRILVLHPSPNESDPFACTLRHVQLAFTTRYPKAHPTHFTYEAVSYTWGDSSQLMNTIYFNNGQERLLVGKNCYAALRRLRLAHKDRPVWIDAVCINQADLQERSRQVRIMNEVYDHALSIMVMLSDHVPDCRLLLDESRKVDNFLKRGHTLWPRPPPSKAIIKQIETVFEEPWFKRTWVLQEVYKKKDIKVVYGSAVIPLEVLRHLCYGGPSNGPDAIRSTRKTTRGVLPRPLELLWTSQVEYSTPQFNLWNRLYMSRECLASNSRDKVFALKSLIGSRQSDIDDLIDYTQSVETLFKRVAEYLLPVLGTRILAAIRHSHELNIPSWMPDWSQTLPLQSLAFHCESDKARMLGNLSLRPTAEDRKRTLESYSLKGSPTRPELHVAGCHYAQIVKSSRTFHFLDNDDAEQQMLNVYQDLHNTRVYRDAKGNRRNATSFTLSQFGRKIFSILSRMKGIDLHYSLTRACGTYGNPIYLWEEMELFYQALQLCKISLLSNGELATVPEDAQSGDAVCIIKGAVAPCLLRHDQNGRWKLISGDCFLFATGLQHVSGLGAYVKANQDRVKEFILR